MIKKTLPLILAFITLLSFNTMAQSKKKQTTILLSSSYGDIKMVLYNETPQHRDNFVKLVKEKFYNGTLFHRVISNFMIQGGDPESKNAKPGQMLGNGGPGYTVPAEFNTSFVPDHPELLQYSDKKRPTEMALAIATAVAAHAGW